MWDPKDNDKYKEVLNSYKNSGAKEGTNVNAQINASDATIFEAGDTLYVPATIDWLARPMGENKKNVLFFIVKRVDKDGNEYFVPFWPTSLGRKYECFEVDENEKPILTTKERLGHTGSLVSSFVKNNGADIKTWGNTELSGKIISIPVVTETNTWAFGSRTEFRPKRLYKYELGE